MKKKILRHSIAGIAAFVLMFFCGVIKAEAETPVSDITMVIGSSCYTYKTQKATTAYRAEYVTFGQELKVMELGTE